MNNSFDLGLCFISSISTIKGDRTSCWFDLSSWFDHLVRSSACKTAIARCPTPPHKIQPASPKNQGQLIRYSAHGPPSNEPNPTITCPANKQNSSATHERGPSTKNQTIELAPSTRQRTSPPGTETPVLPRIRAPSTPVLPHAPAPSTRPAHAPRRETALQSAVSPHRCSHARPAVRSAQLHRNLGVRTTTFARRLLRGDGCCCKGRRSTFVR